MRPLIHGKTIRMPSPSRGPKCPNHGCALEIPLSERGKKKGMAPCQESGWPFEYSVDGDDKKIEYDVYGNIIQTYTVSGEEPAS